MTEKSMEQMGLRDLRDLAREAHARRGVASFQRRRGDQGDLLQKPALVSKISLSPENFSRRDRTGYFHRTIGQRLPIPAITARWGVSVLSVKRRNGK